MKKVIMTMMIIVIAFLAVATWAGSKNEVDSELIREMKECGMKRSENGIWKGIIIDEEGVISAVSFNEHTSKGAVIMIGNLWRYGLIDYDGSFGDKHFAIYTFKMEDIFSYETLQVLAI